MYLGKGSAQMVRAHAVPGGKVLEADLLLVVFFQKGTAVSSRVIIDVVVTDVTEPISGIALKLTYPNLFSKFVKCIDGDLLPPGDCFFAEPGSGSGEVFIGRSITNPQPAVPVSGSKVIVRLEFLVFGAGSDNITIEAQNLGGGDASALLDENGNPILVQWSSGQIMGM